MDTPVGCLDTEREFALELCTTGSFSFGLLISESSRQIYSLLLKHLTKDLIAPRKPKNKWDKARVVVGCIMGALVPYVDWLSVLCFLSFSVSFFPLRCSPSILISAAIICWVLWTRRPVCISPLAVAGKKEVGNFRCMGHGAGYPWKQRGCVQPGKAPTIYGVDVPQHLWDRDEKIPLFFFFFFLPLANTLPTLKVPLHSHSFSFLGPSCMPCWSAGQAVGRTRAKNKKE